MVETLLSAGASDIMVTAAGVYTYCYWVEEGRGGTSLIELGELGAAAPALGALDLTTTIERVGGWGAGWERRGKRNMRWIDIVLRMCNSYCTAR